MARTILVAVDFTEAGREALTVAIGLAKDLGASLVLVHAFQRAFMSPELATEGLAVAVQQPDMEARIEEREGLTLSTQWADRVREAGIPVETETPRGPPWQAVVDSARRHGAAFIVVGTEARKGLERLLAGSVAESIVRHADVPVIVVPHRATP